MGARPAEQQARQGVPPASRTRARLEPFAWAGAVAACTLLAWQMRFVCDDAYISWRYSRHLAEGYGLVWNPGGALDRFLVMSRMTPGHQRLIPLSLLRQRSVTFLIGHPVIADRRGISPAARFTFQEFTSPRLFLFPDEATLRGLDLVEVPLSKDRVMLMVYLTPSPAVDARLATLGWRRYPMM